MSANRHVATIREAGDSVSFGPVGYAAVITAPNQAYNALLEDSAALEAARAEVEGIARTEGPSGPRAYAALLLRAIDEPAGVAALEGMLDSERPCSYAAGGCMLESLWLGEVAARLLDRPTPPNPKREATQAFERLWMLQDCVEPPTDGGERSTSWANEYDRIKRNHHAALPHFVDALQRISRHPEKPAPRYYAALLLAEAGDRSRLRELASDPMPVYEMSGDAKRYITLGAAVRRFLDEEERAGLPAPADAGPPPSLASSGNPPTFFERMVDKLFG